MIKVLVTGSSGFVGQQLISSYDNQIEWVSQSLRGGMEEVSIHWQEIDSVVHLAGIAHRMEPTPDELYYTINTDLTLQFAKEAKSKGVKHFIFMSTIKVYGEDHDHLTLDTLTSPNDAYGKSKLEAEKALLALENKNFVVSIVRPPLIIGPGAKGNLNSLMSLAKKNIPLPFGEISNNRAMISTTNLCAFVFKLITNPTSGTFLVSEDIQPSTSTLLALIREAMGKKPLLFSIPKFLRKVIKKTRPELYIRLFGSLSVDSQTSYKSVGFSNPSQLKESIEEMVLAFERNNNK
jgi:nucleoside-diphosphate-sugar epimerase